MFRTVTVYKGERISVNNGWIVVSGEDGEHKLPLEDIYSRVLKVMEKQYNSMLILVGTKTATEDFLTPKDFIEL